MLKPLFLYWCITGKPLFSSVVLWFKKMVFLIPVTRHQEHLIETLSQLFLFCMLAALVAYGTGCLAGRLAGCLAFAASTFFNCILKILRIQCLDMFHSPFLLSQLVFAMA